MVKLMQKNIRIFIIFFLLQALLHNLGHPVTPAFVRSLEINDYMFGVFFASMSFGLMIGAPLWGTLGDQGHRKTYIFFGLLLYSIGQIGFAYTENQWVMMVFRFIAGFGVVSSMTILTSIVIERSETSQRAKHLAYVAAAITLGASLGYYAGGFLSTNVIHSLFDGKQNYQMIFLIQAILNVGFAFYVILNLKKCRTFEEVTQKRSLLKGLGSLTKIKPSLVVFLISLTLITIGATNLSKYIDVYFDDLGYSPKQLGTFVMATGIVSMFASLFIVPIFARLKKQLFVIGFIQLINAAIVIFVFRAPSFLITIYTVYMIYVIFKAIYQPLEQNYISLHAKEGNYGSVMGLRQSFVSIGMILGPLLGGFLYEKKPLLLFDFSAYSFIIGVILLGIVYVLSRNEMTKNVKDNINN